MGNRALKVPQEIKDRKENLVLMENMEDQDLRFSSDWISIEY